MRWIQASGIFFMLMALACGSPRSVAPAQGMIFQTTASGLGIQDLREGEGPMPRVGQICVVEIRGWVEENGVKGRLFMDTRKRGFPDRFPLGVGRVIKGWDDGLATLKKGGLRLLRVPPTLGYSATEAGSDIPTGSTLIFEVELVELR